jgi:hypothetical protein
MASAGGSANRASLAAKRLCERVKWGISDMIVDDCKHIEDSLSRISGGNKLPLSQCFDSVPRN